MQALRALKEAMILFLKTEKGITPNTTEALLSPGAWDVLQA